MPIHLILLDFSVLTVFKRTNYDALYYENFPVYVENITSNGSATFEENIYKIQPKLYSTKNYHSLLTSKLKRCICKWFAFPHTQMILS